MTDNEYEILDNLYFLTTFDELKSNLSISENDLIAELVNLISKGWVKLLSSKGDMELNINNEEIRNSIMKHNFLASKAGLMNHNSK